MSLRSLPVALLATVVATAAVPNAAFAQSSNPTEQIHLRFATFDPAHAEPDMPVLLRGASDTNLWIVQFRGVPTELGRSVIRQSGAEIHRYLPEYAYVVRMTHEQRRVVGQLPFVRAATYYHPAFRLDPDLIHMLLKGERSDAQRFRMVVVDKHNDKAELAREILAMGGKIDHEQPESILFDVTLTVEQLRKAARLDQVLWIDRWTAPELDMDNARIQGGGDHVETVAGYTGKGINGHQYEGLEAGHKDFRNRPVNVRSSGSAQSHGHCTAGIVYGDGTSNAQAKGMAPDAQAFYTTYGSSVVGSRYQVIGDLVNTHQVMFTTASWGGARTTNYTSISADTDDIIFDHGIPWTNSQSNAGARPSRPEAWAKNIFSCGAFAHRDNANPGDDSWAAGGGSIGPAPDGRIKPDLSAYYDRILCSDLTGSAGYNRSGDYYTNFGGTSGATPIIAGHNALAIQMFTDGLFSPQRVPNGTRWQNRPKFTTLKALQIANASQYSFTKTSTDNRREHLGWGMPNLKTMYDRRNVHFVVDETDILRPGKGMSYKINVKAGEPELKISMCYADPAANPSASFQRINDLTLRVVAPDNTIYWGNAGLKDGNYSTAGGSRDERDTVENVFVKNPAAGVWTVEVGAFLVVQDSHVETTAVDADFGLVSVGGTFVSKQAIELDVGAFDTYGTGCASAKGCGVCFGRNWTQSSANASSTADEIAIFDFTNQATQICGFDFYMAAKSAPVDVEVRIYDFDTQTAQPGKVLGSQKIRVGTQLGIYSAKFATQPIVGAGSVFFVAFDNADKLVLPSSSTGSLFTHYERRNGSWSTLTADTNWSYRVSCQQGNIVPTLSSSVRPLIGQSMVFDLKNAGGGLAGFMFLGLSDKSWNGALLPFSYGGGCQVLTSGDILVTCVTNTAGEASVSIPLPFDKGFIGLVAFQQFFVLDTANPLGLISTNGGRIRVGEF